VGSRKVLNLWKKRKFLLHTENLNRNFPYPSPYPSRYIDCFIPVYCMSIKSVKKRGKWNVEGRKKTKFC
jgi:hypothetical protein